MKTVYEIYTDHFEFSFSGAEDPIDLSIADVLDLYYAESANCPELVCSFNSKEEAMAHFKKDYADHGVTRIQVGSYGQKLVVGDIAYLADAEYDDDGEFVQSTEWLAYSAEGIEEE